MTYKTMDEVRRANRDGGYFFFSTETMAWFSSRIESGLIGGRYFVTSEQDTTGHAWDGQRLFTVRRAEDDGDITTAGEFGGFASLARATQAARAYAEKEN